MGQGRICNVFATDVRVFALFTNKILSRSNGVIWLAEAREYPVWGCLE